MNRAKIIVILMLCSATILAQDLSKVYEKVVNGVVVIETTEKEIVSANGRRAQMSVGGLGTGFLIDNEHIMTAAHVVQTAESVSIRFHNDEVIPADVISDYKNADVALLKLKWAPKEATILKLGDSDQVKIGEQVFVVGSPLGLSYSFSSGYISGRQESRRTLNSLVRAEYLQTDASINQGNSGGPMFNMKGEVVGIVSHILTQSGGFEGIGFAATSNLAQDLLLNEQAMWTGIDGLWLSGDLARIFNLPQPSGMLVTKVVLLSPFGLMGVQGGKYKAVIEGEEMLVGGDIILSFNGVELSFDEGSLNKLMEELSKTNKENMTLEVLRGGQIKTLRSN